MDHNELEEILEVNAAYFNQPTFIADDPISVPHMFTNPGDIEISGFISASLAWGQRSVIIRNARKIVEIMPGGPHEFLLNATDTNLEGTPASSYLFEQHSGYFCLNNREWSLLGWI